MTSQVPVMLDRQVPVHPGWFSTAFRKDATDEVADWYFPAARLEGKEKGEGSAGNFGSHTDDV